MTSQPYDRAAHATLTAAKIQLGDALNNARLQAGNPSYRRMQRAGFTYSPATITRVLRGDTVPKWTFVEEFLKLCNVNRYEIEQVWRPRWVAVAALAQPNKATPTTLINHGTGQNTPTEAGVECQICGAWVVNTARHDEWHNTLATRRPRWLKPVPTTSEQPSSRGAMLG